MTYQNNEDNHLESDYEDRNGEPSNLYYLDHEDEEDEWDNEYDPDDPHDPGEIRYFEQYNSNQSL